MEKSTHHSDEEIVALVSSKNQELYTVIVERYQSKLMRYIGTIVHDHAKASDIVQETFIKAFINLRSFDIHKKFSSWIYRIAHNEALNVMRKQYREVKFDDTIEFPSDEDVMDDFEQRETAEMLRKCIRDIPPLYSEPLALYILEEKSYEEISDILRISMGTVATRISRAKMLMKKICLKN
jgi:RNA polymerase sigma-70 factor (ECF subfamily)